MSDSEAIHLIIAAQQRRQREFLPVLLAAIEAARPAYEKMTRLARNQLVIGDWDGAVVSAGTAAELVTASAIRDLLQGVKTPDKVIEILLPDDRPTSIATPGILKLYRTLSGDEIQKADLWDDFQAHNRRRNALVHRGERCTQEGAAESVAVVEGYILHVEAVLRGLAGVPKIGP